MFSYQEAKFKVGLRLFLRDKPTKVQIVPGRTYESMYRILFEDGSESADFYNLQRVKDNAKKYVVHKYNLELEKELQGRREALGSSLMRLNEF